MGMSERIKKKRIESRLTQEELAEKLGIQKSAVAKYENGRVVNIKRSVIANMAKIFDCSPSYLMAMDEEEYIISKNSYEYSIVLEVQKMNTTGKMKALNFIREMTCNPLYNMDYKVELAAAHDRTDIDVTEEMKKHDDDIMNDDSEWE